MSLRNLSLSLLASSLLFACSPSTPMNPLDLYPATSDVNRSYRQQSVYNVAVNPDTQQVFYTLIEEQVVQFKQGTLEAYHEDKFTHYLREADGSTREVTAVAPSKAWLNGVGVKPVWIGSELLLAEEVPNRLLSERVVAWNPSTNQKRTLPLPDTFSTGTAELFGEHLYYQDGATIYKMPLGGGSAEKVFTLPQAHARSFGFDVLSPTQIVLSIYSNQPLPDNFSVQSCGGRGVDIHCTLVFSEAYLISGQKPQKLPAAENSLVEKAALSPDQRLLSYSTGGQVRLFDIASGQVKHTWEGNDSRWVSTEQVLVNQFEQKKLSLYQSNGTRVAELALPDYASFISQGSQDAQILMQNGTQLWQINATDKALSLTERFKSTAGLLTLFPQIDGSLWLGKHQAPAQAAELLELTATGPSTPLSTGPLLEQPIQYERDQDRWSLRSR